MLELASRSFVFISDADKPALEKKKDYVEARFPGQWYTYADMSSGAITSEDFIETSYLMHCLTATFPEFDFAKFSFPQYGKVEYLAKFLRKSGLENGVVKSVVDQYKSSVFDTLKPRNVIAEYYELLTAIAHVVVL